MEDSSSRHRRPPSMEDVAAIAGVSHQTVSRVLNSTGKVRPETRERVLAAIAQIGYRRNETARALATARSRVIGIITPTFQHYGPASTLMSVQLAANDKGYLVSVAALPEFSPANLRRALEQFLGQGVAGIVLIVPVTEAATELNKFSLPVPAIAISSSWVSEESTIARVGVEQRGGVRAAMLHLKEQGCQVVSHFAGPSVWFDALEREAAWHEAIEEFGLTAGPIFRGDWTAAFGFAMATEISRGKLPDAIFAANDQMALGTLQAFAQKGIRLPDDVRLVGYDDEDASAYFYPSLTTVRQNFSQLGYEAVDALIRQFDGQKAENKLLPAELRVRASA
ncbi:LacI family DNA-binding transcriptional regulator [Changpingibacter yushuensis]|uniref:LacI family DNA-binding transcriptional regulator n=1 Tax=Changpingibacter yushuensis TaxID=2758440 RepID=UPI0015F59AF5|nr:LacI family DNA-binding transcriptional regulator [Changpingibacter yushuensis]